MKNEKRSFHFPLGVAQFPTATNRGARIETPLAALDFSTTKGLN